MIWENSDLRNMFETRQENSNFFDLIGIVFGNVRNTDFNFFAE